MFLQTFQQCYLNDVNVNVVISNQKPTTLFLITLTLTISKVMMTIKMTNIDSCPNILGPMWSQQFYRWSANNDFSFSLFLTILSHNLRYVTRNMPFLHDLHTFLPNLPTIQDTRMAQKSEFCEMYLLVSLNKLINNTPLRKMCSRILNSYPQPPHLYGWSTFISNKNNDNIEKQQSKQNQPN